jgi:hypothetical protein
MTPEQIFSAANLVAVGGWLLLLAVPRHRWTTRLAGAIVPLVLATGYLTLLALHWGEARGGFSTLQGVAELFSNPWLLLAGWVHYLAFDLFVGTWEVNDAAARGVSRWLVAPCLILTFLFGPIGFLAYQAVRQTGRAS